VGEALLVGRKLHKSDNKFSEWCKDHGFGDMKRDTRADSLWLASNWNSGIASLDTEITHPTNIRAGHRELVQKLMLPEDLRDLKVSEKPTVTLDQRSAERLAKVINRANSGDGGSETAKRHVESIAKKHGVSSEELREVVSHADPAQVLVT